MDSTDKYFWDSAYIDGIDYRQISQTEIMSILGVMDKKPETILDIGCGTGALVRQFHDAGVSAMGVDLSDVAIERAIEHSPLDITFSVFDIEHEDIRQLGLFNLITMKLVLAFMKDKAAILSKIKSLLLPGGYFVIITPTVFDIAKATPKMKRISVDNDLTVGLELLGFELLSKKSSPLSDAHELTTYVFKWK